MGLAGGPYVLDATAGQPDAGGPFAGSPFVLHSGFWSLIAGGVASPQADLVLTKSDSPDLSSRVAASPTRSGSRTSVPPRRPAWP